MSICLAFHRRINNSSATISRLLLATLFGLTLSGCSIIDAMVYKIDIPQGNFIETEQVELLRIAMTKEQVAYILGTPMLIDSFDPNTWYYLYHYQEGNGDRKLERKELTITFKNNQLVELTGDYPPGPDFNTPLDMLSADEPIKAAAPVNHTLAPTAHSDTTAAITENETQLTAQTVEASDTESTPELPANSDEAVATKSAEQVSSTQTATH